MATRRMMALRQEDRRIGLRRTRTTAASSGIVVLSEKQYADFDACMKKPQEPTPTLRQGAALLRELTKSRKG